MGEFPHAHGPPVAHARYQGTCSRETAGTAMGKTWNMPAGLRDHPQQRSRLAWFPRGMRLGVHFGAQVTASAFASAAIPTMNSHSSRASIWCPRWKG